MNITKVTSAATSVAVVLAVVNIIAVVGLMAVRLFYPFELEWMEGGVIEHVRRAAAGEPIYVAPTAAFVPFVYPPAFYYAAALLTPVAGDGFLPLRIVSAASSLGVIWIIYLFVRRESGRWQLGIIAAGGFAAVFDAGGAWFDVGRVDMLFLFLLLAALYLLRPNAEPRYSLAAGLLLGLAIMTKQSGIVMAAPAMAWLLVARRRAAITAAVAAAVVLAGSWLALQALGNDWFAYYVLEHPSNYPMVRGRMVRFWTQDVALVVPFAALLSAAYVATLTIRSHGVYYVCIALGLGVGSWMSRGNAGGYDNVLLPAYAVFVIVGMMGVHALGQRLNASRSVVAALPALFAALHFLPLAYNPMDHLPHRSSTTAGRELVQTLRKADGPVWVPYHSYFSTMAGKPPHAHWMAVSDILTFGPPDAVKRLREEIVGDIERRRYSLIVLSTRPFRDFPQIDGSYRPLKDLHTEPGVLLPPTGARRRPEFLYAPQ